MKKVQRKKALETLTTPKQKRPVAKEPVPPSIDFSTLRTVYVKKGSRWLLMDKPNSLDGFQVENYIPAANTLFLSKV